MVIAWLSGKKICLTAGRPTPIVDPRVYSRIPGLWVKFKKINSLNLTFLDSPMRDPGTGLNVRRYIYRDKESFR